MLIVEHNKILIKSITIVKYVWKQSKQTAKYKHFKSKSHQEVNKCKHIILSYKDIDINDLDEEFLYTLSNIIKKSIIIS